MLTIENLCSFLADFFNDYEKIPGLGKIKIKDWIEERKSRHEYWKYKFSPYQIDKLTWEDFAYFFTSKGNLSWSNLPRSCKKLIYDMKGLKKGIVYLQNENVPLKQKLDDIRSPRFYMPGFGKNLITGILHITDRSRYGVWNNRTEKVLQFLNTFPAIERKTFGLKYIMINEKLTQMRDICKIDLTSLDFYMFWLDDRIIKKKK